MTYTFDARTVCPDRGNGEPGSYLGAVARELLRVVEERDTHISALEEELRTTREQRDKAYAAYEAECTLRAQKARSLEVENARLRGGFERGLTTGRAEGEERVRLAWESQGSCLEIAKAEGAAEERAAVVAYLRGLAASAPCYNAHAGRVLSACAAELERGLHLSPPSACTPPPDSHQEPPR